jgi:hypothetical protein
MYLRLSFMEKSVGYASSRERGMGAECLHNMMGEGCGFSVPTKLKLIGIEREVSFIPHHAPLS